MRQFRKFILLSTFCAASLTLCAEESKADDAVDADFPFQGEYTGTLNGRPYGLQVVAMGNGEFQSALYFGGLPGAGASGPAVATILGKRDGESVSMPLTTSVTRQETVWKTSPDGERIPDTVTVVDEIDATVSVNGTSGTATDTDGTSIGTFSKTERSSPTLGAAPPWGATKLFDGNTAWHFKGGKITDDGLLMEGTELKTAYRDFMLHLEFRLPYMPTARGQGRANSGVYLQSRYEVQILDSFGLPGEFNECGALYRYQPPNLNMCLPPLVWQTYDIEFRAARFGKDGKKSENAVITVWHNGVKVHDKFQIEHKTGAGQQEGPASIVTKLQNHSNPVRFRNIWIIDDQAPLPDPLAHPGMVRWSPELYTSGETQGIRPAVPVSGPHVNIHGFVR